MRSDTLHLENKLTEPESGMQFLRSNGDAMGADSIGSSASKHQVWKRINRLLKNYLRCRCGVKNRLKMLIYQA
ncbi:MAG: hypothetical protein IPH22_04420 [Nitrosomonas sp.]|nr:hypothetical protein [Nitrosomonas sp.]